MKCMSKIIGLPVIALILLAGCKGNQSGQTNSEASEIQLSQQECPSQREDAQPVEDRHKLNHDQYLRLRRGGGIGTVILVDKGNPEAEGLNVDVLTKRGTFPCNCLQTIWNEPEHCLLTICDDSGTSQSICLNFETCSQIYARLEENGVAIYTGPTCNAIESNSANETP